MLQVVCNAIAIDTHDYVMLGSFENMRQTTLKDFPCLCPFLISATIQNNFWSGTSGLIGIGKNQYLLENINFK